MMNSVVILLFAACAVGVLSDNPPSFNQPPSHQGSPSGYLNYYSNRNLYYELSSAQGRVAELAANDVIIKARLDGLRIKVEMVTGFRQLFESTTLPNIRASMAAQDLNIATARAQLKDLCTLGDEVEELATKVQTLVRDLIEVRETRVGILADVQRLEDGDLVFQQQIADIWTLVNFQNGSLEDADEKISYNEIKADEVYENLLVATAVVNAEESVTDTIDLTPGVPVTVEGPEGGFSTTPIIQWGIIGSHAVSEPPAYNSYDYEPQEESLYLNVEVVSNNKDNTTFLLTDSSSLWGVEKVRVRYTAVVVDNGRLTYVYKDHDDE